ncbi:MAG: DUF1553 domain-containing protein [Planctomycetota bacterium]|nr:DUF1553 domain-containing protein [Planctomycetota bacterium]MDA1251115.1 DUF1553 domain-containing protein [Planctomycetota bacterium]
MSSAHVPRRVSIHLASATTAVVFLLGVHGISAERFESLAADTSSSIHFDTQIVPLLTRYGCNSGACHGAASGRGGFRLSLYGSNPEFDHQSLAFDLKGRRVNLAHPDESLVLLKPTESLNHGGGERFDLDSDAATLLREWVHQGARRDSSRSLKELRIRPASLTLKTTGQPVEFTATAEFSDGTSRDVTAWTVFKAEDDDAVEVSSRTAVPTRRGRHIVTARFLDRVLASEILVPFNEEPTGPPADPIAGASFIDNLIDRRLSELHLPASPQIGDEAFQRRVSLDLTGRLPQLADVRAAQEKLLDRNQIVERLLKSEAFVDYWTHWLTQLLRVRTQPQDQTAARTFHAWIRTQIESGTPLDELARQFLTASGDTHEVGPANFYLAAGDARAQAEYTSEVLMGVRLRCANCHDHPLDRWSQDDYHGLSAIFAKVKRGRVISIGTSGEVSHPRTGEAAVPRIPGSRFLDADTDGRVALADWLTSPDNPYFARAFVNRIWKTVIGRGLVEPTDDLRATNPATHPELLTQLAADFSENKFDLRHTLRLICTSRVYGRSSSALPGNVDDDRFLSRGIERPLSSAVLADAIADVTGIAEPFAEEPAGTRAVALFATNVSSELLDILGRCTGEGACEPGMESRPGLPTTLHLINGPFLNRRITDPNGRLRKLLAAGEPPSKIVDTFFLTALNRSPSEKEQQFLLTEFQNCRTAAESQALAEDMLWSLLTSREFITRR